MKLIKAALPLIRWGFSINKEGVRFQVSARPRASSQIEKETLKKRITNIEQGITNIEVRYSIIIIFEKD